MPPHRFHTSVPVVAAVFLAALVLLVGGWLVLRTPAGLESMVPEVEETRAPQGGNEDLVAKPASTDAEPTRVGLDVNRTLDEATNAGVYGRCLDSEGSPLVDVALTLVSRQRPPPGASPPPWQEMHTAKSAADGRFSIQFDPPPDSWLSVRASAPGYVSSRWSLREVAPRETQDLGDLVLRRPGTVIARVLDRNGVPFSDGWMVQVDEILLDTPGTQRAVSLEGRPEGGTGECRLDGVPAGWHRTAAHLDFGEWISGPKIEVGATGITRVDLQYEGPDPSRRIWLVVAVLDPEVRIWPNHQHITLSGPGIEDRQPEPFTTSTPKFDDVPPGAYTVTIDDPRFLPWRKEGVVPGGERIEAILRGSSAIRLSVMDGRTSRAMSRYGVFLEPRDAYPKRMTLLSPEMPPPVDGMFEGLVAHSYRLRVEAPQYATYEQELDDLKPDEVREFTLFLFPGGTIAGRVLEADRETPVPDIEVGLYTAAEERDGPKSWFLERGRTHRFSRYYRIWRRACQADIDGRFRFVRVLPGDYVVRAVRGREMEAVLDGIEVTVEESYEDLELVLPSTAFLFGRVHGPEDATLSGLRLVVLCLRERGIASSIRGEFETAVQPDGSYRVGPLLPGPAIVRVEPPSRVRNGLRGRGTPLDIGRQLGQVELAADHDTEKDFDLGDDCPSRVAVSVRVDGSVVPGLTVVAGPWADEQVASVAARTDETGTAHFTLFPGTWRFQVSPIRGTSVGSTTEAPWLYLSDAPLRVAENSNVQTTLTIHLIQGLVTLLDDESGEPLRNRRVTLLFPSDIGGFATGRRTNDDGNLRLRQASGAAVTIILHRAPSPDGSSPPDLRETVSWNPTGPDPDIVRFAVSEEEDEEEEEEEEDGS